jgi:hypothetical protein
MTTFLATAAAPELHSRYRRASSDELPFPHVSESQAAAGLESLIAAGAKLEERHPPINPRIDDLLLRRGSRPDKTLWWYGEKPRRKRVGA